MYSVTKRIDFCYGHRLLDYDGICKHPHGHNAVAEIEIRTEALDRGTWWWISTTSRTWSKAGSTGSWITR